MPEAKQITPLEFIQNIQQAAPRLSESELTRLKKHARAWATVFYQADIPASLERSLRELEVKHANA